MFNTQPFPTNVMDIEKVPSIPVTRSSMPEKEEFVQEISDIWESHWLTNMGMKHQKLQKELGRYLGVPEIDLFANGHLALQLALKALNLQGEVITTPFTFASTIHAIVQNDLTPVFCDINENDFCIDTTEIEKLITDKTCAIVPVHVYGNICAVDQIDQIAKKYGLKVVYDAAHAFGEKIDGRSVGTFGNASIFSFHATKVFHTIEGGAVCFNNSEYGYSLARLKNFGIRDEETVESVGTNAKMNEFSAAMGLCNLRHIDEEIKKRKLVYERYYENFQGKKGLKIYDPPDNEIRNYAYFPIVIDEKIFGSSRNEVRDVLKKNGIGARKYFFPIASEFDCYKDKYDSGATPIALHISKRILCLPMYSDLKIETVDKICELILHCYKGF